VFGSAGRTGVGGALHRVFVAHERVRLLHREIIKEVPNAVGAVERTAHNVVQAQARLAVLDRIKKIGRQLFLVDRFDERESTYHAHRLSGAISAYATACRVVSR